MATEKKEEIIWIACRSRGGCGNNQAKIIWIHKLPLAQGGGRSFRYQCTSCGGAWHIRL